ncbi:hypothetical protein RKE25_12110 [Dyella sp. BiH032]|uniref:hypothetical protein n=1 Tax=Dyella sp. BiH032 TaxID=3075430 RepID=UPI0028937777|nr:hypothetical protein [Dyella sp. BiH032]WNL44174.1 hypothetical protein RKE25_12110 [Dyella sp. BiH032]
MPSHKSGGKTTSGGATGINKAGSVAGKHTSPKKGKPYTAKSDKTLTASQAKSGGFRPDVVKQVAAGKSISKGSFRSPSNPTRRGFKSGYHEAYVVTDATKVLSQRKKSSKGFSQLPKNSSGSWKKHSGAKIREQNVRPALEAGDGARTDTSRTILSAPGGKVAGHTGSGVKTTGQAEAHNLLRDQSVRALSDPQLSPAAQGVVAGLTTLWSMAPGKNAAQAQGASKLKDKQARKTWEEDRNEGKRRLWANFKNLPKAERKAVLKHDEAFHKSLQDKKRKRSMDRPGSPLRETGPSKKNSPIHGGDYFKKEPSSKRPKVEPPTSGSPRDTALHITEPFRAPRRT